MILQGVVGMLLASLLIGCTRASETSEDALRVCGKGNVAYVHQEERRFECKR